MRTATGSHVRGSTTSKCKLSACSLRPTMNHVDQDVFSQILSHIPDSRTVHSVLRALPKSHNWFSVALHRLCELPVYLDTYDPRAASASSEVLDYLLATPLEGVDAPGIAGSIRHLVVAVEHKKYARLPPSAEHEREVEEDEGEEEEDGEKEEEDEPGGEVEAEAKDSDAETNKQQQTEEQPEPEEDIDVVAFHARLPTLFKKTRNLRSLDYHNYPGLGLTRESVQLLAACEGLQTFAVDTTIREMAWNGWHAYEDSESWDGIEPFLKSTLGPAITSLDLRHVSQTTFQILASHGNLLASYVNLKHLKMDITEGGWDWNGRRSPQHGATAKYVFPSLGFPALQRFELVVSDLTVSDPRAGPLDLVDCSLLTELSLDIHQSTYLPILTVGLFDGLAPANFPALRHLEITDVNIRANSQRLSWESEEVGLNGPYGSGARFFSGLVQRFLCALPCLTSLWVDEQALIPTKSEGFGFSRVYTFCSVTQLFDADTDSGTTTYSITPAVFGVQEKAAWRATLMVILGQVESLRVGFGVMDAAEIGLILGCCDPTKLRQFGFMWAWRKHGCDDPISPELLAHLARFPQLTDVHILIPRPETQPDGSADPVVDPRTVRDVAAIFDANKSIRRVGIGHSIVWECAPSCPRSGVSESDRSVVLVSDGSVVPNPAVPRFYHAGHMGKYDPQDETPWMHDNHPTPLRPQRGEEIGQLRDLLKRILE
ncbi:hypothetical protein DFH08DRAFT_1073495 [Mycena albidolilacea]|uniref:Uncharacterized protein n=1 Tax=Mycena albidolilacea TaxID=1033008 RepID=A0AAD7F2A0_9AGAR|nr:hypothetical protein DFH08DRAFT_1073495 [Mycena albidolilacea]